MSAPTIARPPGLASAPSGESRLRTTVVPALVAVALIAGGWELVARTSDGWVPGVVAIGESLVRILTTASTYGDLALTMRRLLIAFVAATVVGITVGALMGFSKSFEAFMRPLIVIGLAIPDPMYFILALLLLGTSEQVGMLALVLAVIPFVVHGADTGVRNRDRGLDEMSSVYRLSRRTYWVDVLARQIAPIAVASMRTSLAFSWKIVVLMEALTQPEGIGAEIYYSFRLLRPDDMIAYALLFGIIMKIIELVVFVPLDRRTGDWSR